MAPKDVEGPPNRPDHICMEIIRKITVTHWGNVGHRATKWKWMWVTISGGISLYL